jgi:hypothetical protein
MQIQFVLLVLTIFKSERIENVSFIVPPVMFRYAWALRVKLERTLRILWPNFTFLWIRKLRP